MQMLASGAKRTLQCLITMLLSPSPPPLPQIQTSGLNVPLKLIAICKLDLLRVNFREDEEKYFARYRTH